MFAAPSSTDLTNVVRRRRSRLQGRACALSVFLGYLLLRCRGKRYTMLEAGELRVFGIRLI